MDKALPLFFTAKLQPSHVARIVTFLLPFLPLLGATSAHASSVYGFVLDDKDAGIGGVTVSAYYEEAPLTRYTQTTTASGATRGKYQFNVNLKGTLRITATKSGLQFTPSSQRVNVSGGSDLKQAAAFHKAAQTYLLGGDILNLSKTYAVDLFEGSRLVTSGQADPMHSGHYTIGGLAPGTYTVKPRPDSMGAFSPESRTVAISNANITVDLFKFNGSKSRLQGIVKDSVTSAGLSAAVVELYDRSTSGLVGKTTTDSVGNYTFSGVPSGTPAPSYIVKAAAAGYSSGSVTVTGFGGDATAPPILLQRQASDRPGVGTLQVNIDNTPPEVYQSNLSVELGVNTSDWYAIDVIRPGRLTISPHSVLTFDNRLVVSLYRTGPEACGLPLGNPLDITAADLCSSRRYYARVEAKKAGKVTYDIEADLASNGPYSDLAPVSVEPSAVCVGAGQPIAFTATAVNNGTNSLGVFEAKVYASANANNSIGLDDESLGDLSFPSLSPGERKQINGSLVTSPNLPDGNYYLKLLIDPRRLLPGESPCNNTGVSQTTFGIGTVVGGIETRHLGSRLELVGQFVGQDAPPYYVAQKDTRINDVVDLPTAATATFSSAEVSWHGGGLPLHIPSLLGLPNGELVILRGLDPLTVDANTGRIRELDAINGLVSLCTFPAAPVPFQITDFELNPYLEGGAKGEVSIAFPVSLKALKELASFPDPDPMNAKFVKLYDKTTDSWRFITLSGDFTKSKVALAGEISGFDFLSAVHIQSARVALDTEDRMLEIGGEAKFKKFGGGTTLTLDYLRLSDYFKPSSVSLEVAGEWGLYPPYKLSDSSGNLKLSAYLLALEAVRVHADNLWPMRDDFELGLGADVLVGFVKIKIPGRSEPLGAVRLVTLSGDGTLQPFLARFEMATKQTLFRYEGFPKNFDGYDLYDGRLLVDLGAGRSEGGGVLHLLDDAIVVKSDYVVDLKSNYMLLSGDGKISLPGPLKIVGGMEASCGLWTDWYDGVNIVGVARVNCMKDGWGVRIKFPGPEVDWSPNIYKQYAQKFPWGTKSLYRDVEVPAGQRFAVVRLTYASGDTEATLTDPSLPSPCVYDIHNAAMVEGYEGPVYYRKNLGVLEDGVAKREICFMLNPGPGESEVRSGTYRLFIADPAAIGDYDVELWLQNTPPAMALTEPATSLNNPSSVHIAWTDSDPDDDAHIMLFYDTDKNGHDGQAINFTATPEEISPATVSEDADGVTGSFEWNTVGLPTGDYYIYAQISDGKNIPVLSNYAPGVVHVVEAGAPAPPTTFTAMAGAASISCSWTASSTAGACYAVLWDDQPLDSTRKYQHESYVEDLTEWTIQGLGYGRDYRVAVVALNPDGLQRSLLAGPVPVALYGTEANNAPRISTLPVLQGRVGRPYTYQVQAVDVDGEQLTYELKTAPSGMGIDAVTGLISLSPVAGHLGANHVELLVRDPRGGTDSQSFYLQIDNWLSPNTAPGFDSSPVTSALVDVPYEYRARAIDSEADSLVYSLAGTPPQGLTIDAGTGVIRWLPQASDAGTHHVVVQVEDGRGGTKTQEFDLLVSFPAIAVAVSYIPDLPQASPSEVVLTANPNQPKYVTDYEWDFGDGTPHVSGSDKSVVRHTFVYDGAFPVDRTFTARVTVTAPGNPVPQVVLATADVVVRPPKPIADFTASPGWTGESPFSVTMTANTQWALGEASGGFAWDLNNDGVFDDASTSVVSHTFGSTFPQTFPVALRVTGPSGQSNVLRRVVVQPTTGTNVSLFDHPTTVPDYWPGWHKATQAELNLPTLIDPSNTTLGKHPTELAVGGTTSGMALALSDPQHVGTTAFRLDVSLVPPNSTRTVTLSDGTSLDMVQIPGGTFSMGRYPTEEQSAETEDPQHQVTLPGFWMGRFEVTKRQWSAVMLTEPWIDKSSVPWKLRVYASADPDSPVSWISWEAARSFISTLNTQTGMEFRLPSESEWEYACRASTSTRFYWGDDKAQTQIRAYAWWQDVWEVNEIREQPVGLKLPNAFGLFDMLGNVSEFCEDDWHPGYVGAPTNGASWIDSPRNSDRVRRGGSYFPMGINEVRSASRYWSISSGTSYFFGFRLACSAGTPSVNMSQAAVAVVLTPVDYLLLSVTTGQIRLQRCNIVGGLVSVVAEDLRALPALESPSVLSISYDGAGRFSVLANGTDTGIGVNAAPNTQYLRIGLGVQNSAAAAEQTFGFARLSSTNKAPSFETVPMLEVSPGHSIDIRLDDFVQDDLTVDAALSLLVGAGQAECGVQGIYRAALNPITHVLRVTADGDVAADYSGMVQVSATDASGLSGITNVPIHIVAPSGARLFTNVTLTAGIIATIGSSVATMDVSGDGLLDLLAGDEAGVRVLINRGNSTFDDETTARGLSATQAVTSLKVLDIDDDGAVDLTCVFADRMRLYRNDGTGRFSDVTPAAISTVSGNACEFADVDGDGDLDLYVLRDGANALFF